MVEDFDRLRDPEDANSIGEAVEGIDRLGLNNGDAERGWKDADARSCPDEMGKMVGDNEQLDDR